MNLKSYLKTCDAVYHVTLDPKTPGVCRLHLVPPSDPKPKTPWVLIINGYSVLPLMSSWAVLLRIFMENLNAVPPHPLIDGDIDSVAAKTVEDASAIFKGADEKDIKKDLEDMIATFKDIAVGKNPSVSTGFMTLSKYAKYMSAPHRMDIMVSAMEKNGCWNCNQKCVHCYAASGSTAKTSELSTQEWKKVLDNLKKARIPSVTFTGGEPTMREDLVELVDHAKWFVTRLNTNGILLTKELCKQLYDASLDSVQVTLYSFDKEIHNGLVGGDHFDDTVQGIRNALEAGLDVSVNTPLCKTNADYLSTVKFAEELGVRYFSCSGMIPAGNALSKEAKSVALSKAEITEIVTAVREHTYETESELSFTSPGWITASVLKKLKMVVPSCGACLSNMAVAPNGDVIPCQSWLGGDVLGNVLSDDWKTVWKGKLCREIRKTAVEKTQVCLLKNRQKEVEQ